MGEKVLLEAKKSLTENNTTQQHLQDDDFFDKNKPKNHINDGEKITFKGDSGTEYYMKRVGVTYYCT